MITHETAPYCIGGAYALRYLKYEQPGVMIRDGTYDHHELQESEWALFGRDMRDHVVLDVGCGVGTLGTIACIQGAQRVHAFEPEECRLKVAQRNAKDRPMPVIRAALGHRLEKKSMTWVVEGCSTLQHDIAFMTLDAMCRVAKPTFVKVSALGAEQFVDWWLLPDTVRTLMIKSRPLAASALAQIDHFVHGKLVRVGSKKFSHTPRQWYVWEKPNA